MPSIMGAAVPSYRAQGRRPELDGVRGIAVLLVVFYHYGPYAIDTRAGSLGAYVLRALSLSWSGVDLFFVLSGFLIGGILLDHQHAENYYRAFYIRRAYRILPLYSAWLVLAVLGAHLFAVANPVLFHEPLPWWSFLTFTQNFASARTGLGGSMFLGVTWSLAVEEQFYLLLPLVIRRVSRARLPALCLTVAVGSVAARTAAVLWWPGDRLRAAYYLLPCRMDALFLGVLAAWVVRERSELVRRTWLRATLVAAGVLLGPMLWVSTRWPSLSAVLIHSVLAVLYTAGVLLAVTDDAGLVARLSRAKWLQWAGVCAYGIYLMHVAMHYGLQWLVLGNSNARVASVEAALVSVLAAGLTLTLARMSWIWLERPLVARGHRFAYRTSSPTSLVGHSSETSRRGL